MPETATAPDTSKTAAETVQGDSAARDATDAKAWESITGEQPDQNDIPEPDFGKLGDDGKTEDPPRGKDGKFAPKGDEKDDQPKEPADKKADPEKKPESKKDDKALTREDRRKIIAAKEMVGRVLKYDDEQIDQMPHDQLLDLAQRVKPTFEAFERMKSDLQKRKDRDRTQKGEATDTPDDGPQRLRNPVDKAEPERAEPEAGGVDQLLRDYLDAETYAKVKSGQRAERAKFQDQASKSEQRAEEANERATVAESYLIVARIDGARDRVAEKFPQLKDDKRYRQFLEVMDELDPEGLKAKGDPADLIKFMNRVAWSEFGEELERTTRHKLVTGNRKDVNGQPETASHGSQPNAMTWDEFDNYAGWASQQAGGNRAKMDALMARVKQPKGPRS